MKHFNFFPFNFPRHWRMLRRDIASLVHSLDETWRVFGVLASAARSIESEVKFLRKEVKELMADLTGVKTAVSELKATVQNEAAQVSQSLASLEAKVQELKAQIEAGSGNQVLVDEILSDLASAKTQVENIIPDAPTEAAPVPVTQ